jgi:hypothetical protein
MMFTLTGDRMKTSVISFLLLFLCFSTSSANADEWRGWRGLEKQAVSDSIEGPDRWTSTSNILWKVEIDGAGHSSPVVSENSVFVTAVSFDNSEMTFNVILINVLLVLVILIILLNLLSLLKNLLRNRSLSGKEFISELLLFSLYGFLIFTFWVMHWMYFDENRIQPARILIMYI